MSKNETESSKASDKKADGLAGAAAALKRGEVIVYPTETLYGLGADALDAAAVEQVFQLKGRDPDSPIPVLVADRRMLGALVTEISPLAEKLMAAFWPGPLTLVLPARTDLPQPLVNRSGGIGVRISSQPIAAQLLEALGRPLTATSANPSGKAPARTVTEAQSYFSGRIEVFIDGGPLTSKRASTVVEIIGGGIKIIRAGEIDAVALEKIIGQGRISR